MGWEWRVFIPLKVGEERLFPSNDNIEKRDDNYYVNSEKCGVKQRNGAREFEVKVLQDTTKRGAEHYKKHIVQKLANDFSSNVQITVHKERQKQGYNIRHGYINREVAYVCVKDKWWKSICWEGEPNCIYKAVQDYFRLRDDWTISDIQLPTESIIGGYPRWLTSLY